ncbi:MAG: tetratricopeptide repeat protein [Deltaproteobacteria bacterium]|nr:tetratricopeptide repeat protein [Deltaproteobacteria bacterium]
MKPTLASALAVFAISTSLLAGCSSAPKTEKKSPKELAALYVELGTGSLTRKEYPEAIEDLRKAITLDSSNAVAHNHLGLAYYGLGKRELAKEEVSRAVSEDSKYSDGYINLGNFAYEEKNNALARRYYHKALENLEYKYRHRALTALAQLALSENNHAEARRFLGESLAANPDYCLTHFLLGTLLVRENDAKPAAEAFAKSVAGSCVNNPTAHYQLGLAYLKLREFPKAKNAFVFLVQAFPQTVEAQRAGDQLRNIP